MNLEKEIKKLKARVWVLTVAFLAGAMIYGWKVLNYYVEQSGSLTVYSGSQPLTLSTSSDGPFVVTHVAGYGDGESDKRWAALPEPYVVMDSDGGEIDLSKLHWRDIRGQTALAPTNQRIEVFYFRPERAQLRN